MLTVIALYLGLGAVAGILAGLLGIGGGLVIVPLLVFAFSWQGLPEAHLMHLALGTSLASIIFTSISSFLAHHRRGAVYWPVVRGVAPGVVLGTFAGSFVAAALSTTFLQVFFALFLYFVCWQMLSGRRPQPGRSLPGAAGLNAVGGGIGIFSSLVGIGGGTLSVPFMLWCNIGIHQAIGTSAAIGFPIAVAGTAGYLINGWQSTALPAWSLGYLYLPALLGIVAASVLTAPLGVRLAHSLPVASLKKIFALLLLLVATRMLWGAW